MKIPRMSTGLERTFRPVTPYGQQPVIYQEFMLHFLHYYDNDGTKLSSKLDKSIPGRFYKEALANERTLDGEYTFLFPDGVTRRLISIR